MNHDKEVHPNRQIGRLKNLIFASIAILFSTTFVFLVLNLCTNIFAPYLFSQERYPRGLLNYVGNLYRSLYPQTHDGKLSKWTAILGDSYAEGAGDAFLTGAQKYHLGHFLRDKKPENFLTFARSGFGSMRAVREFLISSEEMSAAWFLPDLESPNQILFLFYEGNDLTDNLRHLRLNKYENDPLRPFVISEILQPSNFRRQLDYYLPLFRPVHEVTKSIILSTLNRSSEESVAAVDPQKENLIMINSFQIQSRTTGKRTIEMANSIQGTPTELSQNELELAIEVFFECLMFLSKAFPTSEITVVYIPSPATIYKWNDPIRIQTYLYPERNFTTKLETDQLSEYIRNRITAYAMSTNIRFIDSTAGLRAKAESRVLHGPIDWKHLNAEGYALLSNIIDEQRGM